ncbi:MAG: FtsW/RodA/SpoVE family cell cycle protein [Bacilli bacterium]
MNKIFNKIPIYFLYLLTFSLISIPLIYSACKIMPKEYNYLYLKEIIFYIFSFIVFFIIMKIKNYKIYRSINYIYIINIFLLVLVLFIGQEINNTKAWINTPLFSFQPSEFMKLSLTLLLCFKAYNYNFKLKNLKSDIIFIFKLILITAIPCILVFIEPDTGSVISYIIIFFTVLFFSSIKKIWKYIILISITLSISLFIFMYSYHQSKIINIFGNDIFYRINRIIDWKKSSGMQLENSLIAVGSSPIKGYGFLNTPVYFPEPYTDFIFSVYASNYGLIGSFLLLFLILTFLLNILETCKKSNNLMDKYTLLCFFTCFLFSYIENISMTLGLVPISGIPLPFISYGGSSLIVYTIILSMINNCAHT